MLLCISESLNGARYHKFSKFLSSVRLQHRLQSNLTSHHFCDVTIVANGDDGVMETPPSFKYVEIDDFDTDINEVTTRDHYFSEIERMEEENSMENMIREDVEACSRFNRELDTKFTATIGFLNTRFHDYVEFLEPYLHTKNISCKFLTINQCNTTKIDEIALVDVESGVETAMTTTMHNPLDGIICQFRKLVDGKYSRYRGGIYLIYHCASAGGIGHFSCLVLQNTKTEYQITWMDSIPSFSRRLMTEVEILWKKEPRCPTNKTISTKLIDHIIQSDEMSCGYFAQFFLRRSIKFLCDGESVRDKISLMSNDHVHQHLMNMQDHYSKRVNEANGENTDDSDSEQANEQEQRRSPSIYSHQIRNGVQPKLVNCRTYVRLQEHESNETTAKAISDTASSVLTKCAPTTITSSSHVDSQENESDSVNSRNMKSTVCSICNANGVAQCSTCHLILCEIHRKVHKSTRLTSLHEIVDFETDRPVVQRKPKEKTHVLCLDSIESPPKRLIRKAFTIQFDVKYAEEFAKKLFEDYKSKRVAQTTILQQLKKEEKDEIKSMKAGKKKRKMDTVCTAVEIQGSPMKRSASSFNSGVTSEQRYQELINKGQEITLDDVEWIPYNVLRKECSKLNLGGIGSSAILRTRLRTHFSTSTTPPTSVIPESNQATSNTQSSIDRDTDTKILTPPLDDMNGDNNTMDTMADSGYEVLNTSSVENSVDHDSAAVIGTKFHHDQSFNDDPLPPCP